MSKNSQAQRWYDSRQPADRTCCYCHRQLLRGSGPEVHPSNASIDHDIPKRRMVYKGPIVGSDLALSCWACNQAKGDMTGDEFLHFIRTGEILPSYVNWIAEKIKKQMGRYPVPGMVLRGGFWMEK